MSAQPFDWIADLHMAVEQIKREPKPQPDMVPWDEYMPSMKNGIAERLRQVMHWRDRRDRKRGKRRSYFAMRGGR